MKFTALLHDRHDCRIGQGFLPDSDEIVENLSSLDRQ